MNYLKYVAVGVVFGVILIKSEVVSWYRIFEMFHFQSFHMYGIIGSAIVLGAVGIWTMKRLQVKSIQGTPIALPEKERSVTRYLLGGILFGLGWALAGACPGPMYALLGAGYMSIAIVLIGAIIGTFVYGLLRERLPH